MKRRHFVLGAAVAAVAGGWWLRPSDRGGPYSEYFRSLNDELKAHGPMRPVMLIDLDRLDHNIDVVMQSVQRVASICAWWRSRCRRRGCWRISPSARALRG